MRYTPKTIRKKFGNSSSLYKCTKLHPSSRVLDFRKWEVSFWYDIFLKSEIWEVLYSFIYQQIFNDGPILLRNEKKKNSLFFLMRFIFHIQGSGSAPPAVNFQAQLGDEKPNHGGYRYHFGRVKTRLIAVYSFSYFI